MVEQFVRRVKNSAAEVREAARPAAAARDGQAYQAPEVVEVGTLRQMLGTTFGHRRDGRPFCVYTGC